MNPFLAYAGHYHHHYAGTGGWLADTIMRAIVYATVNRVMHGLSIAECLVIAAFAVILFLAFRRS